MREKLTQVLENSYSPYSNYKVAAMVIMKDGQTFKGINVENASYGATICAERTAIVTAITNGYTKGDFKELYILNTTDKIAPPCFMCRQFLVEFLDKDSKIILMSSKEQKEYLVKDLCPYPFDEDNLK